MTSRLKTSLVEKIAFVRIPFLPPTSLGRSSSRLFGKSLVRVVRRAFQTVSLVLGLALGLSAGLALNNPSEALAADPSIRWEKIETPHFTVIFDSRHYELGETYARYAEQAFASLAPSFGTWPKKTLIVIDDSTDLANGYATGIPSPQIVTFPVLPTSLDSISDYGNWGLELVTHEYAHILTFEPATGLARPLRWIFGNIVRPNILLPRWYLEGLAVEMETRHSHYGRMRSSNYLSIVRAMVEDGTLKNEDISRINETSIPGWPGGIRPYLMGALIWDELIRQGGEGIVKTLNLAYSRRIPYLINGPVEDALGGKTYKAILADAYARVETMVEKQMAIVRSHPQTKELLVDQIGYHTHSPVISPDAKSLAFITRKPGVDSMIVVLARDHDAFEAYDQQTKIKPLSVPVQKPASFTAAKANGLIEGTSIDRVAWTPDAKFLIYDSVDEFKRHSSYSDLYKVDVATKKKTRLTRGMRARQPSVSPDGKTIVFTQITPGSTRLAWVGIEGGEAKTIYTPPPQTRIERPEFLNATDIVFTEKRDNALEAMKLLRTKKADDGELSLAMEPIELFPELKPMHFPRKTSRGLLFVSDKSGIANLYLASKDASNDWRARAVTNSTTRVTAGEIDPVNGELLYSRLLSSGLKLFASPADSWQSIPESPPAVGSLVDRQWPTYEEPQVAFEAKREEYSAWPYMLPRYWLPFVYLIPDGYYVSATTSASDPVGRHSYSVSAAFDSLTNKPSFFGQYVNRTTPVTYTLMGEDSHEFIYSGGFTRRSLSGVLSGSFFLPGLSSNWKAALGWQYLQTNLFGATVSRTGPKATIAYSNASRKGLQISPETGGSYSLSHVRFIPDLAELDYDQTELSATRYFSKWLPERHAIALTGFASIAPRLKSSLLGRSTVGGTFSNTLVQSNILMRGYSSGAFLGRNLLSAGLEYRFPLGYPYMGYGTTPFFLQRWHGAVFLDAITLDGLVFNAPSKAYLPERIGKYFLGTGVEVRADATVFYHVPVQFIFGLYYGADQTVNPYGLTPFLGLGL